MGAVVEGPWILAGDWNIAQADLKASGWLQLVKGAIVTTCSATSLPGERCIDYFVIDRRLEGAVKQVHQLFDTGVATHTPVQLLLGRSPRRADVVKVRKPKAFPARRGIGCDKMPPVVRSADPEGETLGQRYECWLKELEAEQLAIFDLAEADKHIGRKQGLDTVRVCELGHPGDRWPRSTKRGRALRKAQVAI